MPAKFTLDRDALHARLIGNDNDYDEGLVYASAFMPGPGDENPASQLSNAIDELRSTYDDLAAAITGPEGFALTVHGDDDLDGTSGIHIFVRHGIANPALTWGWAELSNYVTYRESDEDDRDPYDVAVKTIEQILTEANGLLERYEAGLNAQGALHAIHAWLDGQKWSPDTLDSIAAIVRAAGFEIREPAGDA